MKICDLKCLNSTYLNKLGVKNFSTLLSESIWNGNSITTPALHWVLKQVPKFLLEWHVLIELYWQFESNLLKGFSFQSFAC